MDSVSELELPVLLVEQQNNNRVARVSFYVLYMYTYTYIITFTIPRTTSSRGRARAERYNVGESVVH